VSPGGRPEQLVAMGEHEAAAAALGDHRRDDNRVEERPQAFAVDDDVTGGSGQRRVAGRAIGSGSRSMPCASRPRGARR